MKVKDVRLHTVTYSHIQSLRIEDQDTNLLFRIAWGRHTGRTKAQTIAIAKRLCDRFNLGQQK